MYMYFMLCVGADCDWLKLWSSVWQWKVCAVVEDGGSVFVQNAMLLSSFHSVILFSNERQNGQRLFFLAYPKSCDDDIEWASACHRFYAKNTW